MKNGTDEKTTILKHQGIKHLKQNGFICPNSERHDHFPATANYELSSSNENDNLYQTNENVSGNNKINGWCFKGVSSFNGSCNKASEILSEGKETIVASTMTADTGSATLDVDDSLISNLSDLSILASVSAANGNDISQRVYQSACDAVDINNADAKSSCFRHATKNSGAILPSQLKNEHLTASLSTNASSNLVLNDTLESKSLPSKVNVVNSTVVEHQNPTTSNYISTYESSSSSLSHLQPNLVNMTSSLDTALPPQPFTDRNSVMPSKQTDASNCFSVASNFLPQQTEVDQQLITNSTLGDLDGENLILDRIGVDILPYGDEGDLPGIIGLITKDLSEPYSIYTYRYFIHNWPQLCFKARLKSDPSVFVGAIVCKLDQHRVARRGYIAMLAVHSSYRRYKIASILVRKAIKSMVNMGCDEVVLETEVTNKAAMKLYEKFGFIKDKRLHRYYLNGVDAFRLKLWMS